LLRYRTLTSATLLPLALLVRGLEPGLAMAWATPTLRLLLARQFIGTS